MFGPLEFETSAACNVSQVTNQREPVDETVQCFLCSVVFSFPEDKDSSLLHLFENHKLVIADVHQIADLPRYFDFWRPTLSESNLVNFCTTISADIKKDGVSLGSEYYLLSDIVNEDRTIRKKLQFDTLEKALEQQKFEREDKSYGHGCLFCRQDISSTRADYVNHLSSQHNLQLGKPDNLVYVDEFISALEDKLENLQCIYCEKYFKDRFVLKEHMRKKSHKRVNPDNVFYDRFYIINYQGPDKVWKKERKRRDSAEDDPCDWSDWQETLVVSIVCLFCEDPSSSWENILEHMKLVHNFDYSELTKNLDFYEQVKLVNFIRRQLYRNRCIICDKDFENRSGVLRHMEEENHLNMPRTHLWNQPEFYFPTYENDAFLCQLDDESKELNADLSDALSEISMLTQEEMPEAT